MTDVKAIKSGTVISMAEAEAILIAHGGMVAAWCVELPDGRVTVQGVWLRDEDFPPEDDDLFEDFEEMELAE